NLSPRDWLVIQVAGDNRDPSDPVSRHVRAGVALVQVQSTMPDTTAGRTRIELHTYGHRLPRFQLPALPAGTITTDPLVLDASTVRKRIVERTWSEPDLAALIAAQGWDEDQLLAQVAAVIDAAPPPASVWVQRKSAGAFGANAPDWDTLPVDTR